MTAMQYLAEFTRETSTYWYYYHICNNYDKNVLISVNKIYFDNGYNLYNVQNSHITIKICISLEKVYMGMRYDIIRDTWRFSMNASST